MNNDFITIANQFMGYYATDTNDTVKVVEEKVETKKQELIKEHTDSIVSRASKILDADIVPKGNNSVSSSLNDMLSQASALL